MKISAFAIMPAAVLFVSTFVVAHAADTTTTSGAPSLSTTSGTPDDPNEIVCRRGEPVTGSRFPGPRVCHTRHEWQDIQQQAHDEALRIQTDAGASPGGAVTGMGH